MSRIRIGFLFNHDQVHQVAHSLPVALALADRAKQADILLATTNRRLADEVARLAGPNPAANISFVELRLRRPLSKLAKALAGRFVPAAKLLVYRDNLDFFKSLDLLVVSEKTSLILKRRYRLDRLKIVHTRHGAGDRAIGFNKASAGFDHVLVAGPLIADRLVAEAGLAREKISITGYPKFDLAGGERWTPSFAEPDRPTIVYNPHVSPHLSSWYRMGIELLDWFAAEARYNLIFAPHVMLFERPLAISIDRFRIDRPGAIPERIRRAPNIHIDTGSRLSTTMAYLDAADLYLGDVSSQVYEFLVRPRPCVFLDAHGAAWKDNPDFAFWTAGPVVQRISELAAALETAQADHAKLYAPVQQRLFAERIALTDTPSSVRAAAAVARVAGIAG